ncbi:MAG: hypothetical protein EAY75_10005 [Bacteroidetes bacterium]|nr:MAG: hypothetical protein EAY75_10005 [Bacteroidota bacterium]
MNRKLLYTLATCLLLQIAAYAQPPQREEMLESLRIAYITKQLELSGEEAQKFWPVYNSYQQEQRKTIREHREKKGTELDLEEKLLNLRKRYRTEFTRTISEDKFDRLMKAERNWGEMVRKEMQRRRENGPPPMMNRERRRN